ncbi:degenerin deg-1-like [Argiope bruennichi]|uniref:Degenerin deg-1 like protein n=1 Tax=Argiope bruennichi TaxID=94029 RepID=A0A8T0E590_ARGBR|nr:degenerin deg-1-like [Argiope bruennichi]KAF8766500.1 Degenerin deg-1 like protein [Argiope bruennichi]
MIDIRVYQQKTLEFPTVGICKLNRNVKESVLREIIGTALLLSERKYLTQDSMHKLLEYSEMSDERRLALAEETGKFLEECSFNGQNCTSHQLGYFFHLRYEMCITFNKKISRNKPLQISETGSGTGLIVKLKLSRVYSNANQTEGVKIIIQNPNEGEPDPKIRGIILSPNYETLISLKQTAHQRLPQPYEDKCLDYRTRGDPSIKSKWDCITACIQQQNILKCGCRDPTIMMMKNQKFCNMANETETSCLDDVEKAMSNNKSTCDCPEPCYSINYKEKISRSLLFTSKIAKRLHMNIRKESIPFQINSVRANIFYSSLERQIFEQRPKLDTVEFLSFLGNQLGLWLGLNLFVLFELLEKMTITINLLKGYFFPS